MSCSFKLQYTINHRWYMICSAAFFVLGVKTQLLDFNVPSTTYLRTNKNKVQTLTYCNAHTLNYTTDSTHAKFSLSIRLSLHLSLSLSLTHTHARTHARARTHPHTHTHTQTHNLRTNKNMETNTPIPQCNQTHIKLHYRQYTCKNSLTQDK